MNLSWVGLLWCQVLGNLIFLTLITKQFLSQSLMSSRNIFFQIWEEKTLKTIFHVSILFRGLSIFCFSFSFQKRVNSREVNTFYRVFVVQSNIFVFIFKILIFSTWKIYFFVVWIFFFDFILSDFIRAKIV